MSERLGSTHVGPNYSFSSQNILNEGAKRLQQLGSEVIKVWFHRCDQKYPQHSDWPNEFESMVDRARHPYFEELFDRPFKTFILSAYRERQGDYGNHYFRDGMSESAYRAEVDAFYDITRHLLETYDGTGKEFVLQHWQGDWAIIGSYDASQKPTQTAIDGMRRWLDARQEGVTKAREEVDSDAVVLHAAEVNIVLPAMLKDEPRVINEVVPETNVDLVSHNSYSEMFRGFVPPNPNAKPDASMHAPPAQVDLMQRVLEYINSRTPDPAPYVQSVLHDPTRNVFLGEYGFPEATKGTKSQTLQSRRMTEIALDWGAPWVVYWQLYDNEDAGFWLIRNDNSTTPTYSFFEDLISSNAVPNRPEYVRLDLNWSRQVDQRAFACSKIELQGRKHEESYLFDVGVPLEEPIFWDGCYWVQEGGKESLRWFGGENSRTTIFLRKEDFDRADTIRLRGYPKDGDIEVTLRINGTVADHVELDERRWDWWELTASMTPTPSPTETAASPTVTGSEISTTASPNPEDTQNESGGETETATTADGMGVLSALSGALLAYRMTSDN